MYFIVEALFSNRILLVNLLVPVVQITLFCFCIGQPPQKLPMGYVNYDKLGYDVDFVNINIGQDIIDEMDHKKVLKVTTETFRKYCVFCKIMYH
jgi:hypothetical protein